MGSEPGGSALAAASWAPAAIGRVAIGALCALWGLCGLCGLCGLGALSGCAGEAEGREPPAVFLALDRDFADFERWIVFDRGLDEVPPTHLARSFLYLSELPPPGAERFPVGTRIVRVEQLGEEPESWEVHGMAKRGGGFNAEGAYEWEFFGIRVDPVAGPLIVWRGEGPPTGEGYRPPPGFEGADVLGCNHCHGSTVGNDSVLSPALDLGLIAPAEGEP